MRVHLLILPALLCLLACGGAQNGVPSNDGMVDIPNAMLVESGLLVGGQPSEFNLVELAHAGYETVINLRVSVEWPFDEEAHVEELGMTHISIPVTGASGMTFENAALLDAALDGGGNAVVHCGSGNRAGGLFALRAYAAGGISVDEAMAVGEEHGLAGLADTVREVLEGASAP